MKLLPVPLDGLPPVAIQPKEYGEVPPVAEALQVTATPTLPLVGQLIVDARTSGETVMVADAVAVLLFESVAVTVIVLLPLVE